MKIKVIVFLFLFLCDSPSWAETGDKTNPVESLDYIIFKATLQNFNEDAEVDGLKIRIYYINRNTDEPISWNWPNTDVIYTIYKPGSGESKKDISILSGYDRISSSNDLIYIYLDRKEQSNSNGVLFITVQFPNGDSFSARTNVKLSP
jgi:hypothetical protein